MASPQHGKNTGSAKESEGQPVLITESAIKADAVQSLHCKDGILGRRVLPVGNSKLES